MQLDDPPRIEIDAEADAAADVEPGARSPAAGAADPTARASANGAARKVLVGQRLPTSARSRSSDPRSRRATSECRSCRRSRRRKPASCRHSRADPAANVGIRRSAAQPVVLEQSEELEIGEPVNVLERIEFERFGPFEPEWRAGVRREMPLYDLAHLFVERLAGGLGFGERRVAHGGPQGDRAGQPEVGIFLGECDWHG